MDKKLRKKLDNCYVFLNLCISNIEHAKNNKEKKTWKESKEIVENILHKLLCQKKGAKNDNR